MACGPSIQAHSHRAPSRLSPSPDFPPTSGKSCGLNRSTQHKPQVVQPECASDARAKRLAYKPKLLVATAQLVVPQWRAYGKQTSAPLPLWFLSPTLRVLPSREVLHRPVETTPVCGSCSQPPVRFRESPTSEACTRSIIAICKSKDSDSLAHEGGGLQSACAERSQALPPHQPRAKSQSRFGEAET